MTEIAVVSVLFRGGDAVLRWIEAIERARALAVGLANVSVIAVDNASGDGTPEHLSAAAPWVTLHRMRVNVGFAAGCNAGLALVPRSAIVVLLNPDVAVREDFFLRVSEIDWQDDLAAVGPQVQTPDGDVEQSARAFPSAVTGVFGRNTLLSRLFPKSRMTRRQLLARPTGVHVVDWVSGACLIAPDARFRQVGTLDEGYWMYWEDADWCRRSRNAALRVEYHPEIVVVHDQGSSSREHPFRVSVAFHRSAARYYRKHVARNRVEERGVDLALTVRVAAKLSGALVGAIRQRLMQAGHGDDG